MCLQPITMVNPSKFITPKYRHKYLIQVPCGHCVECSQSKSLEYSFRAYHEFKDTIVSHNGYVLFDTLTYSNHSLPHVSDHFPDIIPRGSSYDFPCFNTSHYRYFMVNLRERLSSEGYDVADKLRVFITSEYGTDITKSHRPHYHVLFFVTCDIPPLHLSKTISDCWSYGRTDGVVYRGSSYVLNHNVFRHFDTESSIRVCRYVAKYVVKSSEFEKEVEKRISKILTYLTSDKLSSYVYTSDYLNMKNGIRRQLCQFHRQSRGFGLSAITDININELVERGYFIMPDKDKVTVKVPISNYFKRKLFQCQVKIDGNRYWQLTDVGLHYRDLLNTSVLQSLTSDFQSVVDTFNLPYNAPLLADYVVNKRGYVNVCDSLPPPLSLYVDDVSLFSYSTRCDYDHFHGMKFVSTSYLGVCNRYNSDHVPLDAMPVKKFIADYVYMDELAEKQLKDLYSYKYKLNHGKQELFDTKQRLASLC